VPHDAFDDDYYDTVQFGFSQQGNIGQRRAPEIEVKKTIALKNDMIIDKKSIKMIRSN